MPALRHWDEKKAITSTKSGPPQKKKPHGFNVKHESMASSLEQMKDTCGIHEQRAIRSPLSHTSAFGAFVYAHHWQFIHILARSPMNSVPESCCRLQQGLYPLLQLLRAPQATAEPIAVEI